MLLGSWTWSPVGPLAPSDLLSYYSSFAFVCSVIEWLKWRESNLHLAWIRRGLTHDAVCPVGGGGAGRCTVVIRPAAAMETGHGRKTGVNLSWRVWRVTLKNTDRKSVIELKRQGHCIQTQIVWFIVHICLYTLLFVIKIIWNTLYPPKTTKIKGIDHIGITNRKGSRKKIN